MTTRTKKTLFVLAAYLLGAIAASGYIVAAIISFAGMCWLGCNQDKYLGK